MIDKSFFQKVGVGLLICKNDQYSTIIEANDAFYTLIGYTKEEMMDLYQNKFSELVVDDLTEILSKVSESVDNKQILDYEYRIKNKLGEIIWIHDVATYDLEYDVFNVVIMDITYKEKALERAAKEANIDKFTGLLNRVTLEKRIIKKIKKNEGEIPQVIFLVDLDNFKLVNDTQGHQTGDKVITHVGKRLSNIFSQEEYVVGRLGGDEFMIFFKGQVSKEHIVQLAERIINELAVDCGDIVVSASIGIFFDQMGRHHFDELYSFADTTLYEVKNSQKGQYKISFG